MLRVRMPISDDLVARNFVTKITKYEKVVNIPNRCNYPTSSIGMCVSCCICDC